MVDVNCPLGFSCLLSPVSIPSLHLLKTWIHGANPRRRDVQIFVTCDLPQHFPADTVSSEVGLHLVCWTPAIVSRLTPKLNSPQKTNKHNLVSCRAGASHLEDLENFWFPISQASFPSLGSFQLLQVRGRDLKACRVFRFIHVAKNGGTAVEQWLENNDLQCLLNGSFKHLDMEVDAWHNKWLRIVCCWHVWFNCF